MPAARTPSAWAYLLIKSGLQECVLCGGAQEVNPYAVGSFDGLSAFSTQEAEPTKASKPFDSRRDGLVPSRRSSEFGARELRIGREARSYDSGRGGGLRVLIERRPHLGAQRRRTEALAADGDPRGGRCR